MRKLFFGALTLTAKPPKGLRCSFKALFFQALTPLIGLVTQKLRVVKEFHLFLINKFKMRKVFTFDRLNTYFDNVLEHRVEWEKMKYKYMILLLFLDDVIYFEFFHNSPVQIYR